MIATTIINSMSVKPLLSLFILFQLLEKSESLVLVQPPSLPPSAKIPRACACGASSFSQEPSEE
jgi:hypothetical protein